MEPWNQTPAQTPTDPINHNDTPNFYSIKLIAKIKLITKMNNWTYISVITTTLNDQNHISGKLYWKCNSFLYFDWSPIPLHGEGGVYDLYCSQPPGGDKRACSLIFKNEWDAPSPNQASICDDIGSENVLNTQAWLSKMPNNNDLKPKIKKRVTCQGKILHVTFENFENILVVWKLHKKIKRIKPHFCIYL